MEQFSINDEDILTLAKWACLIEEYYGRPQDIEWAKDGQSQKLFIVQSRPRQFTLLKPKEFMKNIFLKGRINLFLKELPLGKNWFWQGASYY